MEQSKQSFSVEEFCRLNSISRATFYELRARGEAPAVMKVGRRTLISTEAAAAWRRRCEERASATPGADS